MSLSIFKSFPFEHQAEELVSFLKSKNVNAILQDNAPPVDVTMTGGGEINVKYDVIVPKSEFKIAEKAYLDFIEESLSQVESDYYLFDFSNEELYEILLEYEKWSSFDFLLAKKILAERGEKVDDLELEAIKKKRINKLARPAKSPTAWIVVGYILSVGVSLLGVVIGYLIWKLKKNLPNGDKVDYYGINDRKHGQRIFTISVISFGIFFLFYLIKFVITK